MNQEKEQQDNRGEKGWGLENLVYPEGAGYISTRWDLCVGCGHCELVCSMFHYGVINRELSRIRIYRYLLPLPKSVQNVCTQCPERERECQKACPVNPPVIHYDEKLMHMVVDEERCLGSECGECRDACPANVPQFYNIEYNFPIVCDLCEKDGKRRPQCVEICPTRSLEYLRTLIPLHLERIHPDQKAASLARRLYPLPQYRVINLPEEIWRGTANE